MKLVCTDQPRFLHQLCSHRKTQTRRNQSEGGGTKWTQLTGLAASTSRGNNNNTDSAGFPSFAAQTKENRDINATKEEEDGSQRVCLRGRSKASISGLCWRMLPSGPGSHNQRDYLPPPSPNLQPCLCSPEDRRSLLKCQWETSPTAPDCSNHTRTPSKNAVLTHTFHRFQEWKWS